MHTQREQSRSSQNRSTFFGLPEALRLWALLGSTFWGGMLFGIGIGLLVAAVLVELMPHFKSLWGGLAGVVCASFGQIIALRAVRRHTLSEKDEPPGA